MSYLAKNNAYGQLASGIAAGATSMTLQAGQGDRFPVITNPDYTYVTLEDAAGNREIVKVTARTAASDVMTITRAQEGSVARAWSAGDVAELRMTASLVETAMAHPAQTTGAHAASAIAFTPAGGLASTNVQAALAELDSEKEPAFTSLGFNKGGTSATTRAGAVAALGIEAAEISIATAANATTNIGAAAGTNILLTTTATTITGFATAAAGVVRNIRFSTGGVTLTHSASFVLPGYADIVSAANDTCEVYSTGSGWIVRSYQKANGTAVVAPTVSYPVTSVGGNTGAITNAQVAASATSGYGYTPANPANVAAASHTHSYAPMTAVVAISNYSSAIKGCTLTRANGSTVYFTTVDTSGGGGS